jgi:hypothetical protein
LWILRVSSKRKDKDNDNLPMNRSNHTGLITRINDQPTKYNTT